MDEVFVKGPDARDGNCSDCDSTSYATCDVRRAMCDVLALPRTRRLGPGRRTSPVALRTSDVARVYATAKNTRSMNQNVPATITAIDPANATRRPSFSLLARSAASADATARTTTS